MNNDEIFRLTESNKTLFTENYDLLKYKYLHDTLSNEQPYSGPIRHRDKIHHHNHESDEQSLEEDSVPESQSSKHSGKRNLHLGSHKHNNNPANGSLEREKQLFERTQAGPNEVKRKDQKQTRNKNNLKNTKSVPNNQ